MRKLILLAGTAALAVAAPAAAEKGGKGAGHGHGGGKVTHAERGGGQAARASKPRKAERQAVRAERPARAERRAVRAEPPARVAQHGARRDDRQFDDRGDRPDWRRDADYRGGPRFAGYGRDCPPGLAKKRNGCLPPGRAKKHFARGQRLERDWYDGYRVPVAYRSFYYDTPEYYYRYDDQGYIYRATRGSDLISAVIPLFGGGFGIGQPLPAGYDVYNVPLQYRDTWYDHDDTLYRYGDNAIYRVDSQSGLIEGIVALLAGDLNVGQTLPSGYDAYNLPLDYRDEYYDNDDYLYRYADGNIYQVDAKTQLIQAIVEMIV
ncbi:MAG TPA: hypothetical protein VFZ91_11825 [Allosphingosinicella sp.]